PRAGRGRRLVEGWTVGRRLLRARERIALGQRLDPATRHARVPRVDPALLRHLRTLAHLPVAVAQDEPDRVRAPGRGRLRKCRAPVPIVRGAVPARARALPRLLRYRGWVPHAGGAGADRYRASD